MTLADFGGLVPCDNSTVSRIESGLLAPDLHFAEVADRAFTERHGWFTRFFRDSSDWTESSPFAREFQDFTDDEREASALYSFEHAVIPGLLQTEDYARSILSTHLGVTEAQVAEHLAARLGRQSVLTRDGPPLLWSVIDEMTLHREIGSPKIMHEALLHIADTARSPTSRFR
jgi:hypothetical protein